MPVDELRHTLSEASAAVDALCRRLEGRLEPGEEHLLSHVRTTMRRFEEVMDALIAYVKAADPIAPGPVDLNDVVATAVARHSHELQPGEQFDVEDLPVVKGDRVLLWALFRPLVENAIKYRHPDRALRVRIHAEAARKSMWRIVVEDNGVGIDPAQADAMFVMFERDDVSRAPGQGLGLAAARRIANAHGGAISGEARPEGTAIHVLLPRRK